MGSPQTQNPMCGHQRKKGLEKSPRSRKKRGTFGPFLKRGKSQKLLSARRKARGKQSPRGVPKTPKPGVLKGNPQSQGLNPKQSLTQGGPLKGSGAQSIRKPNPVQKRVSSNLPQNFFGQKKVEE